MTVKVIEVDWSKGVGKQKTTLKNDVSKFVATQLQYTINILVLWKNTSKIRLDSDLGFNKNTGFNNGVSQKLRRGNQCNVPFQPTLRRLSEAHPFFVITQPKDDSYSLKCHRCQFLLNLRRSLARFIVCFSILDSRIVNNKLTITFILQISCMSQCPQTAPIY